MIADATVPLSRFKPYLGDSSEAFINVRTHMLLDSATLESLEIFSDYLPITTTTGSTKNRPISSLADMFDKTATPYGRRLLRKWLAAPLIDPVEISAR